jgi:hypothetical protein
MKTIGEVRETSDDRLLSLPDLGSGSIFVKPTGSDPWAKSPPDLLI